MSRIRTAVIGAGWHGSQHAGQYAQAANCDLRAIVDIDATRARSLAANLGTRAFGDYRAVLPWVDAVSIVTPAATHLRIARDCLEAGLDVLIEKPLALDADEADELISLAARQRRILQVGHAQRFDPVMLKLEEVVQEPLFIESHHVAPPQPRGADVLLDLMIQDIELAMSLIRGNVVHVEAIDAPALGGPAGSADSANFAKARVHFAGGCVASLTASTQSAKAEHSMRFFQRDTFIAADFQNREVGISRRVAAADGSRHITQTVEKAEGDALTLQIGAFLDCVRTREAPKVDGFQGRRALDAALRIRQALVEATHEERPAASRSFAQSAAVY